MGRKDSMTEDNQKLLIAVIGEQRSGKSITWEALFGKRVQKGKKMLVLNEYLQTSVFVFVSSPQEKYWTEDKFQTELNNAKQQSRIILCSLQSHPTGNMIRRRVITKEEAVEIAKDKGFDIFIYWLNPGYRTDLDRDPDIEHQMMSLTENAAVIGLKKFDARNQPDIRAEYIRKMILGWIQSR